MLRTNTPLQRGCVHLVIPVRTLPTSVPPKCRCAFFSSLSGTKGVDGATTVAATSYLASLAGVKVFVTGGMGGVHRGAETTFDVSADLAELAQTPIIVVCAGVKSILDIEKTLEVSCVKFLKVFVGLLGCALV